MPLTLRRFSSRVNGRRRLAVSVPGVEQEKEGAQCEQIMGGEGVSNCGPLGWGHFERVEWWWRHRVGLGGGPATRNYVEGRRGGLEEYPSTYTNGQEVRKTFQGK